MLFLHFVQYSLSFAGIPKNEIPGTALELCQLKIKQFSLNILKFKTKHKDNPFTLNCFMVPHSFLFMFYAGSRRLGSSNFRNSSYKEKTADSARVSRLSFRFLWLCLKEDLIFPIPIPIPIPISMFNSIQPEICAFESCFICKSIKNKDQSSFFKFIFRWPNI